VRGEGGGVRGAVGGMMQVADQAASQMGESWVSKTF
jgi:hypothetical protein